MIDFINFCWYILVILWIQMEEQAIQDLLLHYRAAANVDELITVERVPQVAATPLWKRERLTSTWDYKRFLGLILASDWTATNVDDLTPVEGISQVGATPLWERERLTSTWDQGLTLVYSGAVSNNEELVAVKRVTQNAPTKDWLHHETIHVS